MARQTNEIPILTDPAALSEHVIHYRESIDGGPAALAELGGGVMRFAGAVFPGAAVDTVYAQHNRREGEGRGPHFDIYNEGVDETYPWLGVYNLAETSAVSAAVMSEALSAEYNRLYPHSDDAAYHARRHFGALVLDSDVSVVYEGTLKPETGLILPQRKQGPHIIHEVVPKTRSNPGSFVKMVVPKNNKKFKKKLSDQGFMPLDELLTKSIGSDSSGDLAATIHDIGQGRRVPSNFSSEAGSSLDTGLLD